MAPTRQPRSVAFGFGPNFHKNMGGAATTKLLHQLQLQETSVGMDASDKSFSVDESEVDTNATATAAISAVEVAAAAEEAKEDAAARTPNKLISTYVFASASSEEKEEVSSAKAAPATSTATSTTASTTPTADAITTALPGMEAPWHEDQDPVCQVECGPTSSIFLTESGKIYTAGTMSGRIYPSPTRTVVQLPLKCVQIAAGRHFCVGRMEGGLAVVSWGAGHFGQLGLGDAQALVERPTVIQGLLPQAIGSPVTSVAAGNWHALATNEEGQVWAWGCNRNYQCGRKRSGDAQPSEISSKNPPPTLLMPQMVPNLGSKGKIVKVAGGRAHSVALDEKGAVYCWGSSSYGQCSGTITSKRKCGIAPPRQVEALQKVTIVDIAAGEMHSLALTGGGRVITWGSNVEGQLGLGKCLLANPKPRLVDDLDFVAIEANMGLTRTSGTDANPQPSSATNTVSPLSSSTHTHALSQVPKVVKVQAASNYSVATSSSGHIYAWGCNDAGTLGLFKPPQSALTVLDPSNPMPPSSSSSSSRSSSSRMKEFQTFDSSHNIGLPTRVDCVSKYNIRACGLGPTHMWLVGEERSAVSLKKDRVGLTLHELQAYRKKMRSSKRRYKAQSSTDDEMSSIHNTDSKPSPVDDEQQDTEHSGGFMTPPTSRSNLTALASPSLQVTPSNNGGGASNEKDTTTNEDVSDQDHSSSHLHTSDVASTQQLQQQQQQQQQRAGLSTLVSPSKTKKFRPMKLIKKLSNRRSSNSSSMAPMSPVPDVSTTNEATTPDKKVRRFFSSS